MIHCGPEIKNNQYKTENAMMNAVQLGAILVASNVLPYSKCSENACVCVNNTIQDWIGALSAVIEDEKKREAIYQRAWKHCNDCYAPKKALAVLEETFSDIEPITYWELVQRQEEMMFDILYVGTMNRRGEGLVPSRPSKPLGQTPVSFTGGISSHRSYQIRCQLSVFSELGICFASLGEPQGKIRVGIYSHNHQIRECVLNMEDFVRDDWTYLEFQPIENADNQLFTITFDFEYEGTSALVGVFEVDSKRSLLFRVLNKLGYRMRITDLLFADCR